jgi:hypothetical protein
MADNKVWQEEPECPTYNMHVTATTENKVCFFTAINKPPWSKMEAVIYCDDQMLAWIHIISKLIHGEKTSYKVYKKREIWEFDKSNNSFYSE